MTGTERSPRQLTVPHEWPAKTTPTTSFVRSFPIRFLTTFITTACERFVVEMSNISVALWCLFIDHFANQISGEYKKCFQEFPHEHPKAFIQALHEEILPQVTGSTEMEGSAVESLLKGVTDKGLVAMFATSRKRVATGRKCLLSKSWRGIQGHIQDFVRTNIPRIYF